MPIEAKVSYPAVFRTLDSESRKFSELLGRLFFRCIGCRDLRRSLSCSRRSVLTLFILTLVIFTIAVCAADNNGTLNEVVSEIRHTLEVELRIFNHRAERRLA